MGKWVGGRIIYERTDKKERMVGWMDGWMDGWIDGWLDGWMDGYIIGRNLGYNFYPSVDNSLSDTITRSASGGSEKEPDKLTINT